MNSRRTSAMAITIRHVESDSDIKTMRTLLREYAAYLNAITTGGEHICLESYEKELASLPGAYSQPHGTLLLAYADGEAAGCVALKPLTPTHAVEPDGRACELKRLWVRSRYRGLGLGEKLVRAVLDYAAAQDYTAVYLDTIPEQMQTATALYRRLGFEPTERYRKRELFAHLGDQAPEVIFFRRSLTVPLA